MVDDLKGKHPVLIGDIGGTNARLSIKMMSCVSKKIYYIIKTNKTIS